MSKLTAKLRNKFAKGCETNSEDKEKHNSTEVFLINFCERRFTDERPGESH